MSSIYSPAVRLFPNFTATHAKQAGWLAPVVSFIVFIPVIYMLYAFAKKYKDESFIGIMDDICGRIPGKIILFFYIIWLAIITAFICGIIPKDCSRQYCRMQVIFCLF
jgi:spore germination protein KB